jgi:hypothetical protein
VTHRVEIDPKRRTGLILVLRRTDRQGVFLTGVKVGDEEVKVELLGDRTAGPGWRHVVRDLLKRDRRMGAIVQLDPLDLVALEVAEGFDLETGESSVELGQRHGIGAVQSDELVSGSYVSHCVILLPCRCREVTLPTACNGFASRS